MANTFSKPTTACLMGHVFFFFSHFSVRRITIMRPLWYEFCAPLLPNYYCFVTCVTHRVTVHSPVHNEIVYPTMINGRFQFPAHFQNSISNAPTDDEIPCDCFNYRWIFRVFSTISLHFSSVPQYIYWNRKKTCGRIFVWKRYNFDYNTTSSKQCFYRTSKVAR